MGNWILLPGSLVFWKLAFDPFVYSALGVSIASVCHHGELTSCYSLGGGEQEEGDERVTSNRRVHVIVAMSLL